MESAAMIRVPCPACGREFEFADYLAGLTVVCKNCSHPIPVPTAQPKTTAANEAIQAASEVKQLLPAPAPLLELPKAKPTAPVPTSDGALEPAGGLLQPNLGVPESQRPQIAPEPFPKSGAAVFEAVLEDRIRQQNQELARGERRGRIHRVASVIVGVAVVVLAYGFFGPRAAGFNALRVLGPVVIIWFSDEMGYFVNKYTNTPTSLGLGIRGTAWVILIFFLVRILWFGIAWS
jgi:hypothetical protein